MVILARGLVIVWRTTYLDCLSTNHPLDSFFAQIKVLKQQRLVLFSFVRLFPRLYSPYCRTTQSWSFTFAQRVARGLSTHWLHCRTTRPTRSQSGHAHTISSVAIYNTKRHLSSIFPFLLSLSN